MLRLYAPNGVSLVGSHSASPSRAPSKSGLLEQAQVKSQDVV